MARWGDVRFGAVVLLLVLPWLNPFASGPWSAAVPTLVCIACIAGLLGLLAAGQPLPVGAVAWAWLVAALASSAIGLVQYFGASAWWQPWINSTHPGEAFANLRQRNQFASLTNIGLVVLGLWGTGRTPFAGPPQDRGLQLARDSGGGQRLLWALVAGALLATGNAASSSRTGALQLVCVACLFMVWGRLRDPGVRSVLLCACAAYGLAVYLLPRLASLDPSVTGLVARLNDPGPACASRLVLWRNVMELIAQKPWSGWGWGELDYAHFINLYAGPRFCDILDNAHNLPLHLAVELGLPISAAVCGIGLWLLWRLRPWRESRPGRRMAWAVLAVILVHSLLEYPLWYGPFQIAGALCVWLLWPVRQASASVALPAPQSARLRAMLLVCATVLLAGVAYAAWDYHRVSQIYTAVELRSPAYRENTLEKVRGSWLFRNQVQFADLSTTTVTAGNAATVHALATDLLHFSPESRVVEKLITSALLLGRTAEADFYRARYQAAFPVDYARWVGAEPSARPGVAPR